MSARQRLRRLTRLGDSVARVARRAHETAFTRVSSSPFSPSRARLPLRPATSFLRTRRGKLASVILIALLIASLAQVFTHLTFASAGVSGVSLDQTSLALSMGGDRTAALTATISPSNATNKDVTWSSSNANVASVENGVVTAKSAGSATITTTTLDGAKTATAQVQVAAAPTVDPTQVTSTYVSQVNGTPVKFPYYLVQNNAFSLRLDTPYKGSIVASQLKVKGAFDGQQSDFNVVDNVSLGFVQGNSPNFDQLVAYGAPVPAPSDPKGLRFPVDSSKSYSVTFGCANRGGGYDNRAFNIGGYVDLLSTGRITFAYDVTTATEVNCTDKYGNPITNQYKGIGLNANFVQDMFRDTAYPTNNGVFGTYTAVDNTGATQSGPVGAVSGEKSITFHTPIANSLDTSFAYPDGYGAMKLGGSVGGTSLNTSDSNPNAQNHFWATGDSTHQEMDIQLPTTVTEKADNDGVTVNAQAATQPLSTGLVGMNSWPYQSASPNENNIRNNTQLQQYVKDGGFRYPHLSVGQSAGAFSPPTLNPNYQAGANPNDPNNPQYLEYFNPTAGVYNWTTFDSYMATYKQLGASQMLLNMAGYTQVWNASIPYDGIPGDTINTIRSIPVDYGRWADVVVAFLQHYNGPDNTGQWPRIQIVEIGNENESGQFWKNPTGTNLTDQQRADIYVQMYEASYDKIKAFDPSIQVEGTTSGGWSGTPSAIQNTFLTYFNDPAHYDPRTNSAKYDLFGFHYYNHTNFAIPAAPEPQSAASGLANSIASYKSYVAAHKYKDAPIELSEVGYGIGEGYDWPDQYNMTDALFDAYNWINLAQQGVLYAAPYDLDSGPPTAIGIIDPITLRAYPPYYALQLFDRYQGVADGGVQAFTAGVTTTNNTLSVTPLVSQQSVNGGVIYQAYLAKKRPYMHSNYTFKVTNLAPGATYNLVAYRLYDERGAERVTLAKNLTVDGGGAVSYTYTNMPDYSVNLLRLEPTAYADPVNDFTKPAYTAPDTYSAVTARYVSDVVDSRNNFYDVQGPKFSFKLYPTLTAPAGPNANLIEGVKVKERYGGVSYDLPVIDKIQMQMIAPKSAASTCGASDPAAPNCFVYSDTRQANYYTFKAYAPVASAGKLSFPILANQAGTAGADGKPSSQNSPIFYIQGSLDVYDSGKISFSLNYTNQDAINNYPSIQLRVVPTADAFSNAAFGGGFEAGYTAQQSGKTLTGDFTKVNSSAAGLQNLTITNLYNAGVSLPFTMPSNNGFTKVEQLNDVSPPARRAVIGAGTLNPKNWTVGQQVGYTVGFTLPQNIQQIQTATHANLHVNAAAAPVSQDLMFTQISGSDIQRNDPNENDLLNNATLQGLVSNGTFSGMRVGLNLNGYGTGVTQKSDGSYADGFSPQPGIYNWSALDAYMAKIKSLGINRVGFTFATYTPIWNSTLPYPQNDLTTSARSVPKDANAWAQMCVDVLDHYADASKWPQIVWTDIGNEVYDNRFFNMNGLPAGTDRMQTYLNLYNTTYDAIKAKYPQLAIAGGAEWEPNFLQSAVAANDSRYDQINLHPYGVADGKNPDYYPWLLNNTFNQAPGSKTVPLNLNEFNYDYDTVRWGGEMSGMPGGVWMARVYKRLIDNGAQDATPFDLASLSLGVVDPDPHKTNPAYTSADPTPKPEYDALELLGRYMGISRGDAQRYTAGATSSGDGIETEMVKEGGNANVLVIKSKPNQSGAITVTFKGLAANSSHTVTVYTLADTGTSATGYPALASATVTVTADGDGAATLTRQLPDYGMALFQLTL